MKMKNKSKTGTTPLTKSVEHVLLTVKPKGELDRVLSYVLWDTIDAYKAAYSTKDAYAAFLQLREEATTKLASCHSWLESLDNFDEFLQSADDAKTPKPPGESE